MLTIAEISVAARKKGMTYGKYVQKYGPISAEPEGTLEEPEKKCAYCGKPIDMDLHHKRRKTIKYCSRACAAKANYDVKKERRKQNDRIE